MIQNKIKTKDLNLVTLKYYEEGNGVEVSDNFSYAFLVKIKDGVYINPFSQLELYPVFERLPYYNTTLDGEEYGNKLRLLNDVDVTGPCYIVVGDNVFDKDVISYEELENYILNSSNFFKDRFYIAKDRLTKLKQPLKMLSIMKNDVLKLDDIDKYFYDRMGYQKSKK